MKTILTLAGLLLINGLSTDGLAGFERVDPFADLDSLPKNRTFEINPARRTMSPEEMELDHHIQLGALSLPDGRTVTKYAFDPVQNVIIGSATAYQVSITDIADTSSGREIQALFINWDREAYRPDAADIGVWSKNFEPLVFGYPKNKGQVPNLHTALAIDKSRSMWPYLDKVKTAGSQFLQELPSGKCSIIAFNQLVETLAGGSLAFVNYGGQTFDGRVRDVAPEGQNTDFAALYPEALIEDEDTGNDTKLVALMKAGKWGIPCKDGVPFIEKIEAQGSTDIESPLLLALRQVAVSQRVFTEDEAYQHIIVMITDGGSASTREDHRKEILALKKKTGAKVFVYWIGKDTDRSTLQDIVDFEMSDETGRQEALEGYLDSINVFTTEQQVITLLK
ncbi:MAG: hypothetical protein NPIRA03_25630 [Nitrospirales bacterium]|nr:MAG: hypothetical protein NPIRA03_25630 [Nitrospirales bacterium]